MNVKEYLDKLNQQSQKIFQNTVEDLDSFGQVHHSASCIFDFSEIVPENEIQEMLITVCAQIDYSMLNLALGMYRQSFTALRLAMEFGLGAIFFSVSKIDHKEWQNGIADIKWARIIDADNGILSQRFVSAFFPELKAELKSYREKTVKTYRQLSEYVHGNQGTWDKAGLTIKSDPSLIKQYFVHALEVGEIIQFALSCRYLKSFTTDQLDEVDFLKEELKHIDHIRTLFTH